MTESLPPDADARHAADAAEPPITSPDAEPFDFVPTEPVVPTGPPPATARPGRGPAVALGYLAAALAGALLLGGSLVAFGGVGRASPSPSPTLAPTPTPPPNAADGPSLGSAAAPVTIEVWADYQCPYCRLDAMVFGGSLERAYVLPGNARIVYRDFAFLGQESIDAAVAARCAGSQDPGAYWRFHDLLFASQKGENQGTFKRENLVTLAGIAALDATAFAACLDEPAVAKAVADETGRNADPGRVQRRLVDHQRRDGSGLGAGTVREPATGWQLHTDGVGGTGGDAVAAQLGAARSRRGKTHAAHATAAAKTAPRTSRSRSSKVPARIRVGWK
jgi:protein-disulfide isomerase